MNLHETISVKDSLALEQVLFIDMRTPAEFSKGHIPGAYNLPLFENEERAEIGTLYKQVGPETAKSRGLDIVAPRLPGLVRTISEYASLGKEIVIYCWRRRRLDQSLRRRLLDQPLRYPYRSAPGHAAFLLIGRVARAV